MDQMVREEVERVATVRCSHLIPLNEIPHSPVFRPHDPIPIPYDSDQDQVHMYNILPDIESEIYALLFRSIWLEVIKCTIHVYSEFCALNYVASY